jgi:hypothetical protein
LLARQTDGAAVQLPPKPSGHPNALARQGNFYLELQEYVVAPTNPNPNDALDDLMSRVKNHRRVEYTNQIFQHRKSYGFTQPLLKH